MLWMLVVNLLIIFLLMFLMIICVFVGILNVMFFGVVILIG